MITINRGPIFAVLLIFLLIIASCTATLPIPPEPTVAPSPEPRPTAISTVNLTLASGKAEDNWYPLVSTVGATITKTIPNLKINLKNTASIMENLKLLLNRRVDLAVGYDYHVVLANQGNLAKAFPNAPSETIRIKCGVEVVRPAFPDYKQPVRVVIPFYEEPLHFVTTTTGITTISDLRGKPVSIGVPNDITAQLATYLLTALGFDLEKDITLEYLSIKEAVAALEKGDLDVIFWNAPVPTPDIADLLAASSRKPVVIPIGGQDAAEILHAYPGIFHPGKIPANSYVGLDADVDTLAITLVLTALEELPADQVTQIVSTFFADKHNSLNQPPELTISLLSAEARALLHKGSAVYFEKYGVLK